MIAVGTGTGICLLAVIFVVYLVRRKNVENSLVAKERLLREREEVLKQVKKDIESTQESFNTLKNSYDVIVNTYEEQKDRLTTQFNAELKNLEEYHKDIYNQKSLAFEQEMSKIKEELDDARNKYLSTLKTIALSDEDVDSRRHINVDSSARLDIDYLLNSVAPQLHNPDILYKLIWSEFVQKKTNEMLDYILPSRECSGIYKITNDNTKQAYIGRSVSVRKRLTDHVKGSIGIKTISDQYIHKVMREEGLWNFTFELIEECPKDSLNEREKYYIEYFSTEKLGYNRKAGG